MANGIVNVTVKILQSSLQADMFSENYNVVIILIIAVYILSKY